MASRFCFFGFADGAEGNGVVRILYTAQGHEKLSEAGLVVKDFRSDPAGQHPASGNSGLGGLRIPGLITNKRRRNGRFVQRLIDLDRKLYGRYADIGAQGEPGIECESFERWRNK